jgi:hypothetical protein
MTQCQKLLYETFLALAQKLKYFLTVQYNVCNPIRFEIIDSYVQKMNIKPNKSCNISKTAIEK